MLSHCDYLLVAFVSFSIMNIYQEHADLDLSQLADIASLLTKNKTTGGHLKTRISHKVASCRSRVVQLTKSVRILAG
jgi:hypothetical protein